MSVAVNKKLDKRDLELNLPYLEYNPVWAVKHKETKVCLRIHLGKRMCYVPECDFNLVLRFHFMKEEMYHLQKQI